MSQLAKKYNICPKCWHNRLMGTEKTCIECRAKDAEHKAMQRSNPEYRKKYNAYMRDLKASQYNLRKSNGICTRCGKRNAVEHKSKCIYCQKKQNEYMRLRRLASGDNCYK